MLTAGQSFKLYQIVQRYFNKEEDAQAFVSEIESVIETRFSVEKDRLATKEDLLATKEDLTREISGLKVEMKEQKSDMIKWMFIFWIGQIAATLSIIFPMA
jgi:hypothetical protein